jgi:predicted nucleic acid-binding protein
VKLILEEPGSAEASDLFTTATLIPEANAALARARRDRRLSPAGTARALDVLRGLLAEVEALELDQALAERAGEFAATLRLRGSDAVHLASYELIEDEDSILVAADGELVRAALSLGHAVAVPA